MATLSLTSKQPTYNVITKTYTDSSGNKQSMANAPKGVAITFGTPTNNIRGGGGGGGGSGGGTSQPTTPVTGTSYVEPPPVKPVVKPLPPQPDYTGMTNAQAVGAYADYIKTIRQNAGTYGKDLTTLEERNKINRYVEEAPQPEQTIESGTQTYVVPKGNFSTSFNQPTTSTIKTSAQGTRQSTFETRKEDVFNNLYVKERIETINKKLEPVIIINERRATDEEFSALSLSKGNVKINQNFITENGKRLETGYAMPITASDVTTLAFGGVGLAKGSIITGVKILLAPVITKTTSGLIDIAIPKQDTGFSLIGLPQQVGRGALFLASTSITGVSYATELGKGILNNPVETTSSLIGYAIKNPYEVATISSASRLKTYLPKIRTLEIPQEFGEPVSIKALGKETKGGKAFIIGAKSPKGYGLATPEVEAYLKNLPSTTEIKIGSAIETKILRKAIENIPESTQRARELIGIAQDILVKGNIKSKFIDESQLFSATERLPEQGVKVFLDIAKEEKGILFGSKARAFQLAKEYKIEGETFKLIKVPRDVELRFDKLAEIDLQPITEKAISRLRNIGDIEKGGTKFKLSTARQITEKGVKEMSIEAQVNGEFMKVAEFKAKGSSPIEEEVPEFVVGIKKVGKTMDIQGIKTTRLSEELRGVTQGVLRIRKTKEGIDIYPSPKRLKDIGSVSVTARTLAMSKSIFNPLGRIRLNSAIERFESLFPEGLVREQVEKVLSSQDKEIIADFSNGDITPSFKSIEKVSQLSKISYSPISLNDKYLISEVSESPSQSRSFSRSPSISRSPYKSESISPYASISPNISESPSPSLSPSPSSSPYYSASKSPYALPSKSTSPSPSPSPYLPYYPELEKPKKFDGEKKKKAGLKQVPTFNVFKKTRGKFLEIGEDLTLGQARKLGEFRTQRSLQRTFKVRPSGRQAEMFDIDINAEPSPQVFRDYRIKNGKRIPLTNEFIKRTSASWQTPEEKSLLKMTRADFGYSGKRKGRKR